MSPHDRRHAWAFAFLRRDVSECASVRVRLTRGADEDAHCQEIGEQVRHILARNPGQVTWIPEHEQASPVIEVFKVEDPRFAPLLPGRVPLRIATSPGAPGEDPERAARIARHTQFLRELVADLEAGRVFVEDFDADLIARLDRLLGESLPAQPIPA